ncbi:type IV pilin protein [Psychrobacter sp. UBA3962]|uniref:type IV pilin protein n=1 Tax=Psychrobacter sp. UBA3962 TaxID=1947352 RepID=UPI0025E62BAF|nr:prepilin-type N-terminal cleavage/methylation domain-containing protein [Psychrobacter sp. UBA3962]
MTTIAGSNRGQLIISKGVQGFSLIELMMVSMITAVLMLIALPSYNHYLLQREQHIAQQQGLYLGNQLQRWRARHLTYAGFAVSDALKDRPKTKYSFQLTDATGERSLTDAHANPQGWRLLIQPKPEFEKLELASHYYLDSWGQRCVFASTPDLLEIISMQQCANNW